MCRVKETVLEMHGLGIQPETRHYTALLMAFAVQRDFDAAAGVYQELKQSEYQADHALCARDL